MTNNATFFEVHYGLYTATVDSLPRVAVCEARACTCCRSQGEKRILADDPQQLPQSIIELGRLRVVSESLDSSISLQIGSVWGWLSVDADMKAT